MPGPATPIDIVGPTRHSVSPRHHSSELDKPYSEVDSDQAGPSHFTADDGRRLRRSSSVGNDRRFSISNSRNVRGTPFGSISGRRESLAGSLMTGLSYGGRLVESGFSPEEILMQGTSPFAYQSASFHSSSYLPRMEDQFMRDFACCGIVLPSLHDLLHHYEEQHASPTPIIPRRPSISANAAQQSSGNKNTMTDGFSSRDGQQRPQVQGQARSVVPPSALNGVQPSRFEQHGKSAGFQNDLSTVPDDEAVDAMDMDDEPLEYSQLQRFSGIDPPSGVFNQAPGVQYDYSNDRQYSETAQMTPTMNNLKGYRSPHITTPITPTQATMPFSRHHGTSSMNTTLSQRLPDLNRSGQQLTESDGLRYQAGPLVPFPNLFPLDTTTGPCIDEPGKHLNLSGLAPSHKHFAQLGITESQFMAAGGTEDWNFSGDEPKPFKCPVVGCEKAYKNQNGLKYHKQHGHNTQQLHKNEDGTFSIVNPETHIPYPGTLGMEKEKPYRCDVCGKRYKNLNGLKYHRQHSTACNPDLAQRQSSTESGQVDALSSRTVSAGPSRTSPMPMPAPKYAPLGMGGFGNLDGMTTGPSHMAGTGMI